MNIYNNEYTHEYMLYMPDARKKNININLENIIINYDTNLYYIGRFRLQIPLLL